jgi:hypothetical protein
MPNHDLANLEARTSRGASSRGAFFTPAPKRGATGRNKGGQPSTYTEAAGKEVCRRVVEGQSLPTICKAPGMPGLTTLFEWRRAHPEFAERYARERGPGRRARRGNAGGAAGSEGEKLRGSPGIPSSRGHFEMAREQDEAAHLRREAHACDTPP